MKTLEEYHWLAPYLSLKVILFDVQCKAPALLWFESTGNIDHRKFKVLLTTSTKFNLQNLIQLTFVFSLIYFQKVFFFFYFDYIVHNPKISAEYVAELIIINQINNVKPHLKNVNNMAETIILMWRHQNPEVGKTQYLRRDMTPK